MKKKQERLGKSLGLFQVFAIGTGTMIGAGIFVLPSIAISTAGPAAIFAFVLGGLITLATTLSVVELATAMPRAGGSYYFISRALGPMFGTVIGLGAYLSLVFKGSFALIGLAEYLNVFFDFPVVVVALISGILLILINYRGAKSSGNLQNIIVVFLILILVAFIIKGMGMINRDYLDPFMPYGVSSVFETTGIIFISYLGIVKLAAVSEEVKNPDKNIPIAFLGSVIFVIILYAGIIFIINGMVDLETLKNTKTPLVYASSLMAGMAGTIIITIAGFFATISTANAAILSSSRFPFAMARDDLLPKGFIDIHKKFKTPYKSLLATGGVMLALIVIFDVQQLAKLGSTFNVLVFALVNLSLLVYRKGDDPDYKPSFKDPFFPVSQFIGILGSLMLLPSLGLFSSVFALVVIGIGILWYLLIGRNKLEFDYSIKRFVAEDEVAIRVDDSMEKILVPVSNPNHEKDLLKLADHLGDVIVGLNIIKVPEQVSLSEARECKMSEGDSNCGKIENIFDKWSSISSSEQKYIVAFDHDVSNSIIEQAKNEDANLILMGWKTEDKFQSNMGNIVYKVLKNSQSHIAILKGSYIENPKKIVVAYDGKHNSRYALYLGKKLAINSNALLKVISVVSPDDDVEYKDEVHENLKEAVKCEYNINIEYELIQKYEVTDVILDATRDSDLTILGDSSKRFKKAMLSTVPQRVANHSKNPVLIIKRHQSSNKVLKYFE